MSSQYGDPRRMAIFHELKAFVFREDAVLDLKKGMSPQERRMAHELAAKFGLDHVSLGSGSDGTYVRVSKVVDETQRAFVDIVPADDWDDDMKLYFKILKTFDDSPSKSVINFPTTLTAAQRRKVHDMAEALGFDHNTSGSEIERTMHVSVFRVPVSVRLARAEQRSALSVAISATEVPQLPRRTSEGCKTPQVDGIRVAEWNCDNLDQLFVKGPEVEFQSESRVKAVLVRMSLVLTELNADIVCICEGPRSAARMRLFVERCCKSRYQVYGDRSIFFLIRAELGTFVEMEECQEYLAQNWSVDLKGNCVLTKYSFTRRPLVIRHRTNPDFPVLIGTHLKSQFIRGGVNMWDSNQPEKLERVIIQSVYNRRRIAAECIRLRTCIETCVLSRYRNCVVAGDLNDGPGPSFFNKTYLLPPSVDLLSGSPFYQTQILHSVLTHNNLLEPKFQWSVKFDDYIEGWPEKPVLIDHFFASRKFLCHISQCGVAHDIYDRFNDTGRLVGGVTATDPEACVSAATKRALRPSDHRPIWFDFKL